MTVQQQTSLDRKRFRERQDEWGRTHLAPVAEAIRVWAEKSARGNPPEARKYLRDVTEHSVEIAMEALAAMVAGIVRQDKPTGIATSVGRQVEKVTGKPCDYEGQRIQIGYLLISLICDVTGCAVLQDKHGDRPTKVTGGIKLSPVYELRPVSGKFLADAAEFGKVGMPTFSHNGPAPWTDNVTGGVRGQEDHGMVHGAKRQMRGVDAQSAPKLYQAVNAAQAARFRINPVTADVIRNYDNGAAVAWLTEHFIRQGKSEKEAVALAKEAARL